MRATTLAGVLGKLAVAIEWIEHNAYDDNCARLFASIRADLERFAEPRKPQGGAPEPEAPENGAA